MYVVLPSRIKPDFRYNALYIALLGPTPLLGKPGPYPPNLGVSQVGPEPWQAPLERAPIGILVGLGFLSYWIF